MPLDTHLRAYDGEGGRARLSACVGLIMELRREFSLLARHPGCEVEGDALSRGGGSLALPRATVM